MKAKCRNCGHKTEAERCPKCSRLMPHRWFIIVGTGGGDCLSERMLAHTPEKARSIFTEFHKDAVISKTWDCGQDQPNQV